MEISSINKLFFRNVKMNNFDDNRNTDCHTNCDDHFINNNNILFNCQDNKATIIVVINEITKFASSKIDLFFSFFFPLLLIY